MISTIRSNKGVQVKITDCMPVKLQLEARRVFQGTHLVIWGSNTHLHHKGGFYYLNILVEKGFFRGAQFKIYPVYGKIKKIKVTDFMIFLKLIIYISTIHYRL